MVTVQMVKRPLLVLPEEIGQKLHLRDGEKVDLWVVEDRLAIQRLNGKEDDGLRLAKQMHAAQMKAFHLDEENVPYEE